MKKQRLILSILSVLSVLSLPLAAQTTGQWRLSKRNANGTYTDYGLTAVNGQAIGFTGGLPAMLPITASTAWADITGKPTEFAPAAHNQAISTITGLQAELDSKASTASLASYLTSATAASTYAPLSTPTFSGSYVQYNGVGGSITQLNGSGISVLRAGTTAGNELVFPGRNSSVRTYNLPDINSTSITLLDTATAASTYLPISTAASTYLPTATAASTYQPLDSDLTAIAALSTASFGRSLLTGATAGETRTLLGLGGTDSVTFSNLSVYLNSNSYPSIRFGSAISGDVYLSVEGLSATRNIAFPDASGTFALTTNADGTLANNSVTNAMLAGSIALSKLATTGTANSTTYLRGDGAWTTISSGATLGANTFTGLQQFSGTTHAGIRLNNLTTTQRDAIASPAAGMLVWNTTTGRMSVHNGTSWTAGMVRLDGDTMTGQLQIAQGTIAASAPLNITQTWNSGTPGTGAFSMLTLNATLTNASSTSSGFLTCIRDGTTRLFIDSGGIAYFGGANAGTATCVIDTNNQNVSLRSSAHLDWMGDTKLYRLAAGVIAPRSANSTTGAAIEFLEQTAPAAPSADRVRIYAEDNGSGKTRLVVRWSDGTTTVLATQP